MLWSLIFTLAAHAATPEQTKRVLEAQPECANFVRVVGEKLMLGFGAYWPVMGAPARSAIPSTLKVVDLGDESLLTARALDAGVDALEADGQLFVLTYEGLEERDLLTLELRRLHSTHGEARALGYKDHAMAMVRVGQTIVIAHGRLGLSVFDLNARAVTMRIPLLRAQLPHESMATSLALAGGKLFVLMDNFTLPTPNMPAPFRGLVVINPATMAVEKELAGIDPGATDLFADGQFLVISYLGQPLWKYRLSTLNGNRLPRPAGIISDFGQPGHPTGKLHMDETYLHGCFMQLPETAGKPVRLVPRSLARRDLNL
jgi:hypothetical protein